MVCPKTLTRLKGAEGCTASVGQQYVFHMLLNGR